MVIFPLSLSQKKKCNSTSRQLFSKENHTGSFTHGTILRSFYSSMLYRSKNDQKNWYLFRFSIFMGILFIHVDTETFVPLTCIYTLTIGTLRWGAGGGGCIFVSVDKVSLWTVWGQNHTLTSNDCNLLQMSTPSVSWFPKMLRKNFKSPSRTAKT